MPLDHVAVHVASRDAAEEILRDFLGYEVAADLEAPSGEGTAYLRVMVHPANRFYVVLCEAADPAHPISKWVATRGPGVHHLAHRVVEVEAALDASVRTGSVAVGGIVEIDGLRQVFVESTADGILHELIERSGGDKIFAPQNTAKLIDVGGHKGGDSPPPERRRPRR